MPLGAQKCRQPGGDGGVAALRSGSHQAAQERHLQQRRPEDLHQGWPVAAGGDVGFRVQINLRFFNVTAHVENQERGQESHHEQSAPGRLGRKHGKEKGVQQRRRAPSDRPAGLHDSQRFAAMLGADHFSQQHRARGPLASEAKTQQGARGEQLFVILGKPRQERENRKPQDRDLECENTAVAVREPPGEPSAQCRNQQGSRLQAAGLTARDSPGRNQRRDHKAEQLNVHRVQRPTADARREDSPFAQRQSRHPAECARADGSLNGFRCLFHAPDCITRYQG